jgi:hypothetical protein
LHKALRTAPERLAAVNRVGLLDWLHHQVQSLTPPFSDDSTDRACAGLLFTTAAQAPVRNQPGGRFNRQTRMDRVVSKHYTGAFSMTPSRFRAALLAAAIVLSACESTDPTAPLAGSDGLAALLGGASGEANAGGSGGRTSLFERLASEIEGFGGLYRTAHCSVAVVLTDLTQSEQAIRIVKAALEPNRACPDGLRVHAVQGQFTYNQLQRYLAASRELMQLRGVLGAHIDVQQNRLVITIAAREVAPTVLEALPRVGIPADAVVFAPGRTTSNRTR